MMPSLGISYVFKSLDGTASVFLVIKTVRRMEKCIIHNLSVANYFAGQFVTAITRSLSVGQNNGYSI
jgi:hypothetical protein